MRNVEINALSGGKSMGLIGMPMAQVKTIKKEEKCLTTPPHTPMLTQRPRRVRGSGGKEEKEKAGIIRGIPGALGGRNGDVDQ